MENSWVMAKWKKSKAQRTLKRFLWNWRTKMSSFLKLTKINIKSVINAMFARKIKNNRATRCFDFSFCSFDVCVLWWNVLGDGGGIFANEPDALCFYSSGNRHCVLIVLMVAIETSSGVFRGKTKNCLPACR